MKIFYGAAIQGSQNRKQRAHVHKYIIDTIKNQGYDVYTEHTTGTSYEEAIQKLEQSIGTLPTDDLQRRRYVRNKMIEGVESDIAAAIFEVSTPSLGTGVEIAHAYLRPRMNLTAIPVLAVYQKEYWPNKLSTMIRGISKEAVPYFTLREYEQMDDLKHIIEKCCTKLKR